MLPTLRTLLTTVLCASLGAAIGSWSKSAQKSEVPRSPETSRPSAAVASASELPSKPPPFVSVTASMEWVKRQMEKGDFEAAELLFRQEAGLTLEQRLDLAEKLVRNYRRMDPRVLARILLSLPVGEVTTGALSRLITEWCADDADDALGFLEAMPAERLNTILLHNAGFGLSRLPVERVAAFAAKLNDKGRAFLAEGLAVFADQAGSWSNTSAILEKINAKPDKEAISVEWQLAVNLATLAPQEAERLIAAEADLTKRDEMLGGYAWVTGVHDPVRGIELDTQIVDAKRRESHFKRHVSGWLNIDRAAALTWLRSSEAARILSAEQRAYFFKANGLEVAR